MGIRKRGTIIAIAMMSLALSISAQTDMVIYDDALRNGWANWGWATIDYNQTAVVHSGSKAGGVTMTGSAQAVYIFHGTWIRGSTRI